MLWPSGNDYYEAPSKTIKGISQAGPPKGQPIGTQATILNTLDRYILQKSIAHNVSKTTAHFIKAHDKKLKKLTKNVVLPFTSKDTITNLSGYNLTPDQLEALKFGLTHSIYPPTISKTDIFACFERSHTMNRLLIDTSNTSKIVADLSHLAHCYISSHRPTTADLKKHSILRSLRKNRDIVILKPDKGNGIVILNRTAYDNGLFRIINDSSKFKPISKDPTLTRESRLQRFLRDLKKQGKLENVLYDSIYPNGSQPARIYGLPKLHKLRDPTSTPPFRPIVSSIGTYNYNLAKLLCNLLEPYIPNDYNASDTFTFVQEINNLPMFGKFLISFDVVVLVTSLPKFTAILNWTLCEDNDFWPPF